MLNWQIGKKYRRRDGNECTAIRIDVYPDENVIQFDKGYAVWEKSGKIIRDKESPRDIIEEVNEMKIEVGKYYKTRNGYKAHILHILDCEGVGNKNIVGYTMSPDGVFRDNVLWTAAGTTNIPYMELIEEWKEPKSGVGYVNVYADSNKGHYYGGMQHTATDAKQARRCIDATGLIACVRVEWKEGQFDD